MCIINTRTYCVYRMNPPPDISVVHITSDDIDINLYQCHPGLCHPCINEIALNYKSVGKEHRTLTSMICVQSYASLILQLYANLILSAVFLLGQMSNRGHLSELAINIFDITSPLHSRTFLAFPHLRNPLKLCSFYQLLHYTLLPAQNLRSLFVSAN